MNFRTTSLGSLLLIVLGCGGGGGNGNAPNQTSPLPVLRGDLIGTYTGTLSTGGQNIPIEAFISDSITAIVQTGSSINAIAVGTCNHTPNGISGSLLYNPYGTGYGIDSTSSFSFIGTGLNNNISGTFTGSLGSGTMSLSPELIPPNYHITLANLAGTWSGKYSTISIDNAGNVTGSETGNGATITGNVFIFPTANQPFIGLSLIYTFTFTNQYTGTTTVEVYNTQGIGYMSDYSGPITTQTMFNRLRIINLGKLSTETNFNMKEVCHDEIIYKE